MRRPSADGPERFLSHVAAADAHDDLFRDFYLETDARLDSVAGLRRRRRQVANASDTTMKTVSLVDEDGVLYWRDGIPARAPGTGRRARRASTVVDDGGALVLTREFPALAPNKVVAALGAVDQRLNPAIDASLRSRLRRLQVTRDGQYELSTDDVVGPFSRRTLLFVHGTFSNATNMLGEFTQPSSRALAWLGRATQGRGRYDQVLFFEHPTLSVSPVINALELGRAMAGTTGQLDVVAHSRGGLVVRWWLEAFGASLGIAASSPVRAVLVGSPLRGTSLAAPDRIQHAMSLVANIGSFAEHALTLAGTANPFLWVSGKLIEIIVSVTGALAKTPIVDALAALVPGLAGQSAVINNHELNRLRTGPVAVTPAYGAVVSNFETDDPGLRFWRNFRKERVGDLVADVVFPGTNDLVVDTWSMTDFGVPGVKLASRACDFGTSDTVWHCNYFRQARTIDYLAAQFGLSAD